MGHLLTEVYTKEYPDYLRVQRNPVFRPYLSFVRVLQIDESQSENALDSNLPDIILKLVKVFPNLEQVRCSYSSATNSVEWRVLLTFSNEKARAGVVVWQRADLHYTILAESRWPTTVKDMFEQIGGVPPQVYLYSARCTQPFARTCLNNLGLTDQQAFNSLRSLTIGRPIQDKELIEVLRRVPSLVTLNLSVSNPTRDLLGAIAIGHSKLRTLVIVAEWEFELEQLLHLGSVLEALAPLRLSKLIMPAQIKHINAFMRAPPSRRAAKQLKLAHLVKLDITIYGHSGNANSPDVILSRLGTYLSANCRVTLSYDSNRRDYSMCTV